MSAKRAVIRIQLDPQATRQLDQLCEQRGMTQIAVLSRAVTWLTRQSNLIQTAILGGLSAEDQSELAKVLLKRMAKGDASATDGLALNEKRTTRRSKSADASTDAV